MTFPSNQQKVMLGLDIHDFDIGGHGLTCFFFFLPKVHVVLAMKVTFLWLQSSGFSSLKPDSNQTLNPSQTVILKGTHDRPFLSFRTVVPLYASVTMWLRTCHLCDVLLTCWGASQFYKLLWNKSALWRCVELVFSVTFFGAMSQLWFSLWSGCCYLKCHAGGWQLGSLHGSTKSLLVKRQTLILVSAFS